MRRISEASLQLHHHYHRYQLVVLEMETVRSGFTLELRHRGRSLKMRDHSLLCPSLSLSHSLFPTVFLSSFSLSLSFILFICLIILPA